MNFNGIDLLLLEVNSLEESVKFYVEQLGFELESRTPEDENAEETPLATLRAGDLKIMLAQQLLTMARRGRGVHFFFTVSDVDAYHAQLNARGIVVSAPVDENWGGRFITLEDPDRYRLFFVTWI